jgi:hypothetical protein
MRADVWIGLGGLLVARWNGALDGYLHHDVASAFAFCIGRLDS